MICTIQIKYFKKLVLTFQNDRRSTFSNFSHVKGRNFKLFQSLRICPRVDIRRNFEKIVHLRMFQAANSSEGANCYQYIHTYRRTDGHSNMYISLLAYKDTVQPFTNYLKHSFCILFNNPL